MISALVTRTDSGFIPLAVAAVPTGRGAYFAAPHRDGAGAGLTVGGVDGEGEAGHGGGAWLTLAIDASQRNDAITR